MATEEDRKLRTVITHAPHSLGERAQPQVLLSGRFVDDSGLRPHSQSRFAGLGYAKRSRFAFVHLEHKRRQRRSGSPKVTVWQSPGPASGPSLGKGAVARIVAEGDGMENLRLCKIIPMPQSLSALYVHAVFSTKARHPYLVDLDLRSKVHALLEGQSRRLGYPILTIGGVADHVHILARQSPKVCLAEWVGEIKRHTSPTIQTLHSSFREFHWQSGYGAFSVAPSGLASVREYIARQEEHHRARTFKDEFMALLVEHDLEWDERYVWD